MGKIVLFVSREETSHQAHNILQEQKYELGDMKLISTENSVTEARQAIASGASIIIARGLQASLIKQYTDIPVVEIVMTAQEMALLVIRAKQIIKKTDPVIGVVGFKNMFCDMSFFDELYGITLKTYFAEKGNELENAIEQALKDEVDLLIGGDTAIRMASEKGMPSLFLSTTEDCLRQALSLASKLDYAMSTERRTTARWETLLDYSYNGIMRLDETGRIKDANLVMKEVTNGQSEKMIGRPVGELIPQIDVHILNRVLTEGKEESLFLELGGQSLYIVMAPVLYEKMVDEVIVTCHRVKKYSKSGQSGKNTNPRKTGMIPLNCFEDLLQLSPEMKKCIQLARLFAMTDHPLYIWGETGTEIRSIAESIHNLGRRSQGPFVSVFCEESSPEKQREELFGAKGAVHQASGGTLLLWNPQELTARSQICLCQLIRFHTIKDQGAGEQFPMDVRVIFAGTKPFSETMCRNGKLEKELYYQLQGFGLEIPSLRRRPEDLKEKLKRLFSDYCEQFGVYHVLSWDGWEALLSYSWPGNQVQAASFMERLALTARKRTLGRKDIEKFIQDMEKCGYCKKENGVNEAAAQDGIDDKKQLTESDEAVQIRKLLIRHSASREKTAKALGISKSTLWRKIRRYGLENIGKQQSETILK